MFKMMALLLVVLVCIAGASALGSASGDRDHDGLRNDPASHHAASQPPCAEHAANVRDGDDPWGGCFPGPSNTGTPDGAALTDYTGPCRVTAAETVINRKTVDCDRLDIFAKRVVVKNSYVNGSVWIDSPNQGGSVTVTDTTIDSGAVNSTINDGPRAICCARFTAIRIEALGGVSGGFCEYYCEVRHSWIHGQDRDEGGQAHASGLRLGSGTKPNSQRVIHNTILCEAPEVLPEAGCSADVTGYGDFDTIRNNLVKKNLLESTPSGGYCAYGGSTRNKPHPLGTHNRWHDNVFQRGPSGRCGVYGAITDGDFGKRGNEWKNNRWDTGERMPDDG